MIKDLPSAMSKCKQCLPGCNDHVEIRPYERSQSEKQQKNNDLTLLAFS